MIKTTPFFLLGLIAFAEQLGVIFFSFFFNLLFFLNFILFLNFT